MASQLAQTAKTFRMMIAGIVFFMILYLIFSQVLTLVNRMIIANSPPKPIPPSVAWGKLPKLNLKSLVLEEEAPIYNLETTTGKLPTMADKINVYKFIEPQASFLSLERTKSLARKLGFQGIPKEVSPSLYFWQEGGKTLQANTVTGNFQIDTDLTQLTYSVGDLPALGEIKSMAKGFLDSRGLLHSGYEIGPQEATIIKKNGPSFGKAISLSETSLARIDFFRGIKEGDDSIIYALPQDPKKGLIELYYVGAGDNFPKIKFTVWYYDLEKGETYPLRSIDSAWQEIKENRGYATYLQYQGDDSLESLTSLAAATIDIRKISLAYFDDEDIQNYLQPIYIFEGDGKSIDGRAFDIILYLPAVDPAWIE